MKRKTYYDPGSQPKPRHYGEGNFVDPNQKRDFTRELADPTLSRQQRRAIEREQFKHDAKQSKR